MIAIVADDFTGAAELAGISLRFGLTVQLALGPAGYNGSDVFIVSTDSRSLSKEEAIRITSDVINALEIHQPEFIFKKIDSVLRGHVLDELRVQAELTKKEKVFILPANPSLGRTIKDGHYFINGKEIHLTSFASDPEFAITNSSIVQMLNSNGEERVLKMSDQLPDHGVVIGEADSSKDINNWVKKIDTDWLLAGAGDFYHELLGQRFTEVHLSSAVMTTPHLYVSGTTFDKSRKFISKLAEEKGPVVFIDNSTVGSWLRKVNEALKTNRKCIIAIPEGVSIASAAQLRQLMADLTRMIVTENKIAELYMEGGSTAATILNELNLREFKPVNELQRGVVRMEAGGMFITVKPGSYDIPQQILNLYS